VKQGQIYTIDMARFASEAARSRAEKRKEFEQELAARREAVIKQNPVKVWDENDQLIPEAVSHFVGVEMMREKLEQGGPFYMRACYFRKSDCYAVLFNNKPLNDANDNLRIWTSTAIYLNSPTLVEGIMVAIANVLTLLGYEVQISGAALIENGEYDPFTLRSPPDAELEGEDGPE
tara:strand:- start:2702 stop:3229 length:528 start_codon:yes stop_codon:yes gene_type:complete